MFNYKDNANDNEILRMVMIIVNILLSCEYFIIIVVINFILLASSSLLSLSL